MSGVACSYSPCEAHTVNDIGCGMPLSPLGSAHVRTTLGMTCDHLPWAANRVGLHQSWHAMITLGQHTRSDDVGHDMQELRRDNIHSETMLGMECNHLPLIEHTIELRQAWHARMALELNTRLDDVCVACHHHPWAALTVRQRHTWNSSITVGQHTRSDYVGCAMLPSPLVRIDDGTTSSMPLPHGPWATHTVAGRRVWHATHMIGLHWAWYSIISIDKQIWSDYVKCGMPQSTLDSTSSDYVGHDMQPSPLGNAHDRMRSGIPCTHRPCEAYTLGQRWAWHVIISLGHHTQSDHIGRGMPACHLGSTDGWMTSSVACHNCHWAHTWSDEFGREMPSTYLGNTHGQMTLSKAYHHRPRTVYTFVRHRHTRLDDFGMACHHPPLKAHSRMRSGVACYHFPWTTHTIGPRRVWHASMAVGKHIKSDDIGRGMQTIAIEKHTGCGMLAWPLESTHDQTTSSMECHHNSLTTYTVGLFKACHVIIVLGQHTRSEDIKRVIPAWALENTHSRMMSGAAYHHSPWEAHDRMTSCMTIPSLS
ncbi:hypothetical protein EJD97_011282 [Solanum chilense]|uniref:Uncharacterized protein n=1 Tax=Solanum chilense TaxID=4083 RepID=A0A6N2BJ74_SOLCI|nr:hypothetical protein EJD97_011282 [Solanum chilense]